MSETMSRCASILMLVSLACAGTGGAQSLRMVQGDFVIQNFRFTSGEMLPELRLHYRTLGRPQRDAKGQVRNAVLIMHGTGGTGAQFETPSFEVNGYIRPPVLGAGDPGGRDTSGARVE